MLIPHSTAAQSLPGGGLSLGQQVGILRHMKQFLLPGLLLVTALAVLLAIMFGTNPEQAPPYVSMIIFVALYGVVVAISWFVLALMRFLGAFKWPSKRLWRYAGVGALLPVALLLLQSIGQLTVRDVALLAIFGGLVGLYVHRSRQSKNRE